MWHNDPVFSEVLVDASISGQPFRVVSEKLLPEHVQNKSAMPAELQRVFHCPEVCVGKDIVLIWAVDRPYTHSDGKRLASTIVYIEKLAGSVRGGWPKRYLENLATDFESRPLTESDDLRHLAKQNRNYTFYSRLVSQFGPMSLWQASAIELNESALLAFDSARAWEHRLLCKYLERHGCFPLKNKQA